MPNAPSAVAPAVTLHPDSLCHTCTQFDGGVCRYLAPTLDGSRSQPEPVTACTAYDAIPTAGNGESA